MVPCLASWLADQSNTSLLDNSCSRKMVGLHVQGYLILASHPGTLIYLLKWRLPCDSLCPTRLVIAASLAAVLPWNGVERALAVTMNLVACTEVHTQADFLHVKFNYHVNCGRISTASLWPLTTTMHNAHSWLCGSHSYAVCTYIATVPPHHNVAMLRCSSHI